MKITFKAAAHEKLPRICIYSKFEKTLSHILLCFHEGERYEYDANLYFYGTHLEVVVNTGGIEDDMYKICGRIFFEPENDLERKICREMGYLDFSLRDKENHHLYIVKAPVSSDSSYQRATNHG